MHRIDGQGAVASLPTPEAVGGTVGYFAAAGAVPPTQITGDWLNAVQEEIVTAIANITGATLSKTDRTQLYDAIIAAVVGGGTSISEVTTTHLAAVMASQTSAVFGAPGAVIASRYGLVQGDRSAVIASDIHADESDNGGGLNGNQGVILASESTGNGDMLIDGNDCAVIACLDGVLTGNNGSGISSAKPSIGADVAYSSIIASDEGSITAASGNDPLCSVLLASRRCNLGAGADSLSTRQHVVAGGYSGSGVVAPSWRIESNGGYMRSTQAHVTTGLDYAELFENGDGVPQRPGRLQTLKGRRSHLAQPGDRMLGPVSVTPTVIGGDDGIAWSGRYERDKWGAIVWEIVDGVPQMMTSPKWDPDREQVSRQNRPADWTVVGLLGQVRIPIGPDVVEGDALMPGKDGIGVTATREYLIEGVVSGGARIEVMEIVEPYDAETGEGVALCLVR